VTNKVERSGEREVRGRKGRERKRRERKKKRREVSESRHSSSQTAPKSRISPLPLLTQAHKRLLIHSMLCMKL